MLGPCQAAEVGGAGEHPTRHRVRDGQVAGEPEQSSRAASLEAAATRKRRDRGATEVQPHTNRSPQRARPTTVGLHGLHPRRGEIAPAQALRLRPCVPPLVPCPVRRTRRAQSVRPQDARPTQDTRDVPTCPQLCRACRRTPTYGALPSPAPSYLDTLLETPRLHSLSSELEAKPPSSLNGPRVMSLEV